MSSAALDSGCAPRAVPKHGPTDQPAATVAADRTPGRLMVPPWVGPIPPDEDRFAHIEARPESIAEPIGEPEATPALLATTNVRVTQLDFASESETTVAVDPNNPLHLVVGAITTDSPTPPPANHYYSSLDGGHTWTEGSISGQLGFSIYGDPSIAYCGDGSVYYETLSLFRLADGTARSGVMVDRSTDGGLTWPEENRSMVVDRNSSPDAIVDKPWIACDTTNSAFAGRIYVLYSDTTLVPAGSCTASYCRSVKVKRSVDHGLTWSPQVMVSDLPNSPQNGGQFAIGPLGELYVAWVFALNVDSSTFVVKFDKSLDGGVSFGTDVNVVDMIPVPADPRFRRSVDLTMDADQTNGPYRGTVYIVFSDYRNGDVDIFLVRSTNGGTTWSPPVRVNDDPLHDRADQWFSAVAVDPLGRVVVTWSDRRRYVGTEKYEVWGAISRDGGRTFDTNFLIGDTPSDVPIATFLGDYNSVAATSDRLYATWADQRPGLSNPADIYTDAFPNTFRYDEVNHVVWTGASQMSFDTQDSRFGVNLEYDVAGGLLSELHADQAFGRASCTAPAWPAPPFVDGRVPPSDDGYYYLVRAHGPAGVGTYGDAPPARPNLRDPLNQTLVTCP